MAELVVEADGTPRVRRLSVGAAPPHPGVVVCADPHPTETAERENGWAAVADRLAAVLPATAVLVDVKESFSPAVMVADIRATARALRDEARCDGHVAVVGFGLGGALAVTAMAGDRRIEAAVALGSAADLPRVGYGTDAHLDRLRAAKLADPADVAAWRREFIAHSPANHVSRLDGRPVLAIHGAADPDVPVDQARALVAFDGGRFHLLPTAGHRLRANDAAFEVMVQFLRDVWR